jgi:hypothetical protein
MKRTMNIHSFKIESDNMLTILVENVPGGASTANTFVTIGNSPTKYATKVVIGKGTLDNSIIRLDPPPIAGPLYVIILSNPAVKSEFPAHLHNYDPPPAALKPPTDIMPPPSAKAGTKIAVTGKNLNSIDKWFLGDGGGIDPEDVSGDKSHFTVPRLGAGRYQVQYSATGAGVKKTGTGKMISIT